MDSNGGLCFGNCTAVNTKTGEAEDKAVLAVLVHYDKDLYDLAVKAGQGHEVIHTTSHHLFWDPRPSAGSRPPS